MSKFIIIEVLEAECFNDKKHQINLDNNGDLNIYDSKEDAIENAIGDRIPKFVIGKIVSQEMELPYDPLYDN